MDKLLQPESIIENWPKWGVGLRSRPVLLNELSGGRSNRSFLLNSDIGKLALRITGTDSLLPGASRHNEISIWQEASKQGIAPPLVFVGAQNQYLISSYIKNELPPEPQLNPSCVDQAFSLLERCHQLDMTAPSINYADHIEGYRRMIESREKSPNPTLIRQHEPMLLLLESLAEQQHLNRHLPPRPCHRQLYWRTATPLPDRLGVCRKWTAHHGLRSTGNRVATGRFSRPGTH